MEGDHEINLKEYCRCCAKKMTESMKKRRRSKGSLKIKPSVQKFIFGEDKEGIDPEFLCRTCVRLLEKVNHEYHKDQKYKKENYDDESNVNEKVEEAEKENENFRAKSEFKPHEENNCRVCENTSTQTDETPTKKTQEKDFQQSPSIRFAQSEEPQPHQSPKKNTRDLLDVFNVTPRRPSAKACGKVILSKIFTKKTDNILTEVKVPCGNESIKPSQFLDEKVASTYMCALCKGVPSRPRQLDMCRHIYCRECLNNWKSEATTCCAIEETSGDKCCRNLDRAGVFSISGFCKKVWLELQYNCKDCGKINKISDLKNHKCKKTGRKGHKCLSDLPKRSAKLRLNELFEESKKVAEEIKEKPEVVALKVAELHLLDADNNEQKKEVNKILKMVENPEYEPKKPVTKLTPVQQAALRVGSKMSTDQLESMRKMLEHIDRDHRENGIESNLNIFWSYGVMHKEDLATMPSNVNYVMKKIEAEDELGTHMGYVHEARKEEPKNIMEDFEDMAEEHPAPNMAGSYFKATDVIAKKLEDLMPEIEKEYIKKVKEDPNVDEQSGKVICISKFSGDGIGETEPIKERKRNVLPSKIFKMSTMWLRIVFRREGFEDILILKNPKPNSMYETPLTIAYADESDDFSMRVVYQKVDYYIKLLEEYTMTVGAIEFYFQNYQCKDGKWTCRSCGSAGANHDFNCARCLVKKNDFTTREAPRRTPQVVDRLSTRSAWNPENKSDEELYEESKGCVQPGIAPYCPDCQVFDCLHGDLNMQKVYTKAATTILAFCHTGDTENSTKLKWRLAAQDTEVFEVAQQKFTQHTRMVLGINDNVASRTQNPGNIARAILGKTHRKKLYSILPECKQKEEFLKSCQKFDIVRSIYNKKNPTKEDRTNFQKYADDWHGHKTKMLPWVTSTNVCHQILCHISPYLNDPKGTGSISDLSTGGGELGNKMLRESLRHLSFKGVILKQTRDCLNFAYLASSYKYQKIVGRDELSEVQAGYKCGKCGERGHNRRTCFKDEDSKNVENEEADEVEVEVELNEEEAMDQDVDELFFGLPEADYAVIVDQVDDVFE